MTPRLGCPVLSRAASASASWVSASASACAYASASNSASSVAGGGVREGRDPVGLLCTGDVVGVLFAGSGAARPSAVLLVADGAGPLVVLCGSAPAVPAAPPGVGVLPALDVLSGDAAE